MCVSEVNRIPRLLSLACSMKCGENSDKNLGVGKAGYNQLLLLFLTGREQKMMKKFPVFYCQCSHIITHGIAINTIQVMNNNFSKSSTFFKSLRQFADACAASNLCDTVSSTASLSSP